MESVHQESARTPSPEVIESTEGREEAEIKELIAAVNAEYHESLASVAPDGYDSPEAARAVKLLAQVEALEAKLRARLPQN